MANDAVRPLALLLMVLSVITLRASLVNVSPKQAVAAVGTPQTPAGISGRVVDVQTKTGIAGVVVRIVPAGSTTPPTASQIDAVLTDERGAFVFRLHSGGTYTVTATKSGYLDGGVGKTRPSDVLTPVAVASGSLKDVEIPLWRAAVITGRVVDDAGDPLIGQRVSILQRQYVSGRRRFTTSATSTTDDRGEFRISPLAPGEYVACAVVSDRTLPEAIFSAYSTPSGLVSDRQLVRQLSLFGEDFLKNGSLRQSDNVAWASDAKLSFDVDSATVSQTTCAPTTTDLRTVSVTTLAAGEVKGPEIIRLSRVPGVAIQGRLEGSDASPGNVALRLTSAGMEGLLTDGGFEAALTMTDGKGDFRFIGVPSGTYRLTGSLLLTESRGGSSGSALRWVDQEVLVGRDEVKGLVATLRPGFQVSGRVTLEAATSTQPPPDLTRFSMRLEPVDGRQRALPVVSPNSSGEFKFGDVPPGNYFLRARNQPQGWIMKGALLESVDVADDAFNFDRGDVSGIKVTFSDRPSIITATVRRSSGEKASDATVYAITTNKRYWIDFGWAPRRLRWVRTNAQGEGQIVGLPAGSYFITALPQRVIDGAKDIGELLDRISNQNNQIVLGNSEQRTVALIIDKER